MRQPKIRKMGWFVKMITFGWPNAITLAPFGIYIKEQYVGGARIENHERIHWEQQIEMLILPFYLWYLIEWFIRLFIHGKKAYMNISFEREAYSRDTFYTYLEYRPYFAWWKYLKK